MNKYLILITCALISACDGGGDSAPAAPQSFSLAKLNSTAEGTIYSSSVAGTDNDGFSYNGFISVINRPKELLGGVLVTPTETLFSLNRGSVSISSSTTYFTDAAGYYLGSIDDGDVICFPATPYRMPSSVEVGDFDSQPIEVCDDGTTLQSTWHVETAPGRNAYLIVISTYRDAFDVIDWRSTSTYTLNAAGDILAIKNIGYDPQGDWTLTLTSN